MEVAEWAVNKVWIPIGVVVGCVVYHFNECCIKRCLREQLSSVHCTVLRMFEIISAIEWRIYYLAAVALYIAINLFRLVSPWYQHRYDEQAQEEEWGRKSGCVKVSV